MPHHGGYDRFAHLIDRSRWIVQESAEAHNAIVITSFDIPKATLAHWLLLLVSRTINGQIYFIRRALRAEDIPAQFAVVLCKSDISHQSDRKHEQSSTSK